MTKCYVARSKSSNAVLQRKCGCESAGGAKGTCAECDKKRLSMRRSAYSESRTDASSDVPQIVHDAMGASGHPLDDATRAFMEPRFGHVSRRLGNSEPAPSRLTVGPPNDVFEQEADDSAKRVLQAPASSESIGHDFSRVRVHTDGAATESARALGANAYTVGEDIFFGAGQYAPHTTSGRQLLAHELTHVVQQSDLPHPAVAATSRIQRAISPELDQIESLLSYGIVDWAIRDAEAIKALEILKTLPKYQQAVFAANTKYLDRLRDNLPDNRIPELDALLASVADIGPPKKDVQEIESKLSYGIFDWAVTDEEAVEVLEKLKKMHGEQLTVTLGAINYGRLMDNLPDSRKVELIDLLTQNLGTGGAKGAEEKEHPGSQLNSITFTSDYGVMKDNSESWSNGGNVVQPEWSVAGDKIVNVPISQKKGTNVSADLSLNVLPLTAPTAPITVRGESDEPALNFTFNGSMQGGLKQSLSLTSQAVLPNAVTMLRDREIRWKMKWKDWEHEFARTAHTIYVTMDPPGPDGEVTIKRMDKAVEIIGALHKLAPHDIVKGIMTNWNVYNLAVPLHNPVWTFADDIATGGQCIDIVNFVMALIKMVGCPGVAEAMVIWAKPESPFVPIESLWITGGGMSSIPYRNESGSLWQATLLDGSYHSNNFEAALKFNYGGTLAYYPGGVDRVMSSTDQVLRIFRCLAWVLWVGGQDCEIKEVPANYPENYEGPTCAPGMRKTCYVT